MEPVWLRVSSRQLPSVGLWDMNVSGMRMLVGSSLDRVLLVRTKKVQLKVHEAGGAFTRRLRRFRK
jgi:hypothetical protein